MNPVVFSKLNRVENCRAFLLFSHEKRQELNTERLGNWLMYELLAL